MSGPAPSASKPIGAGFWAKLPRRTSTDYIDPDNSDNPDNPDQSASPTLPPPENKSASIENEVNQPNTSSVLLEPYLPSRWADYEDDDDFYLNFGNTTKNKHNAGVSATEGSITEEVLLRPDLSEVQIGITDRHGAMAKAAKAPGDESAVTEKDLLAARTAELRDCFTKGKFPTAEAAGFERPNTDEDIRRNVDLMVEFEIRDQRMDDLEHLDKMAQVRHYALAQKTETLLLRLEKLVGKLDTMEGYVQELIQDLAIKDGRISELESHAAEARVRGMSDHEEAGAAQRQSKLSVLGAKRGYGDFHSTSSGDAPVERSLTSSSTKAGSDHTADFSTTGAVAGSASVSASPKAASTTGAIAGSASDSTSPKTVADTISPSPARMELESLLRTLASRSKTASPVFVGADPVFPSPTQTASKSAAAKTLFPDRLDPTPAEAAAGNSTPLTPKQQPVMETVFVTADMFKSTPPVPPAPKLTMGIDTSKFNKKSEPALASWKVGRGKLYGSKPIVDSTIKPNIDPTDSSRELRKLNLAERQTFGNGPVVAIEMGNDKLANVPQYLIRHCSEIANRHFTEFPDSKAFRLPQDSMDKVAATKHIDWMLQHLLVERVFSVTLDPTATDRENLVIVRAARVLGFHVYVGHFTKHFCDRIRGGNSESDFIKLVDNLAYPDNDPIYECLAHYIANSLQLQRGRSADLEEVKTVLTELPKLNAKVQQIISQTLGGRKGKPSTKDDVATKGAISKEADTKMKVDPKLNIGVQSHK